MSKVIIIGGGISGLTAGIKLLNAGHQVTLIEKNKDVGGLCSGYFVDGFLVDTCIHWLMGTKKGNFINDLWREIGGLGRKVKIISLIKAHGFHKKYRAYLSDKLAVFMKLQEESSEVFEE